jgi:hypothetical protein
MKTIINNFLKVKTIFNKISVSISEYAEFIAADIYQNEKKEKDVTKK